MVVRRTINLSLAALMFSLIVPLLISSSALGNIAPDLVMTVVSGPMHADTESQIVVSTTVKNQGDGKAWEGFWVGLFLSSDNMVTTSDILLGNRYIGGLAAGAEVSVDTSVVIPRNAAGTYYLGAIADYTNLVSDESIETNNALAGNQINIGDNPPTADAGGPYTVEEGSSIVVTASANDPDDDPLSFAWDLDNDGTFETPGQTVAFSASQLDGPVTQTIALKVTDTAGLFATDEATVDVTNVSPTVEQITVPADPVEVGADITASAGFTDVGLLDTHTAIWNWGDGNTSTATLTETNGSGTVTDSHTYSSAGVYTVTLTVTDDDDGSGESVLRYIVIYDPSTGFVTGSGWIDSPEGAYVPEPSLVGVANFGFVSKYQKGTDIPTGQTQFSFDMSGMNFHSTSYEWLVVAGYQVKYKGEGTINGTGNYGFMLSAVDAALAPNINTDLLRMKIWDKDANDSVVYDNQLGADDDAEPTTVIGEGSIVIHLQGSSAAPAKPVLSVSLTDGLGSGLPTKTQLLVNYPNPFNPETWFPYELASDVNVKIIIYDIRGQVVRELNLGHQRAGMYLSRDAAAHWDGRNWSGESVSSGVYFYELRAGDFTATRRMLVMK